MNYEFEIRIPKVRFYCPTCREETTHTDMCDTNPTDGSYRIYKVCDKCDKENPDLPVFYYGPEVGGRRTSTWKWPAIGKF